MTFLFFRPVLFQFYTGFIKDFKRELVRIAFLKDYALYSRVDDHLGAQAAGLMSAVERCSVNGYAQFGLPVNCSSYQSSFS